MRPHPIFTRPAAARASLTVPEEAVRTEEGTRLDSPWVTLVWNDPVNLMRYVAYGFASYFGYSPARAHELRMPVTQEGRAGVAPGRAARARGPRPRPSPAGEPRARAGSRPPARPPRRRAGPRA